MMWSSWILGFPARAHDICSEMLANAEKTANPFAIAAALGFSANFARDRGDLDHAMMLTTRSLAHATEQKLHFWLGPALCTQGWARVERGEVEAGIAQIEQGLSIYETIGIRVTYDYHRSGLIEAHLQRGAAEEGLALVRDALGRYGTLLDCFYEAELHRLEGELRSLLRDSAGAEASFRKALETAHRQHAKSFELRAATSLARLRQRQGRNAEARVLLAPIYGWFTEGFETRDLVEAKILLDELI